MADTKDLLAVGLTLRQAEHWTRRGWLRLADPHPGSGHLRDYPEAEVDVAADMVRLVAAGLTPAAAHRVARGETMLARGVHVVLTSGVAG